MEPLFPRLHVKDTEKGGPKAPPRNKMAVYEELATPSSRLALGSRGRPMSLNSNDDSQMGHVHGGKLEKRHVSSFYGPPTSTNHTTPRLTSSRSSDGIFSKAQANSTPRSLGYVSLSVFKNSLKSLPSKFARVERRFSNEEALETQCESINSGHNKLKRANVVDLDPDDHDETSPPNGQRSSPECQRPSKKLASASAVRANALSHESSKSLLSNVVSDGIRCISAGMVASSNVASESSDNAGLKIPRSEEPKVLGNGVASSLRTDSCLVPSIADNNPSNTRELDRKTSVAIAPNDAALKISHETFWKTRRTLINQQRALSFQVFELHRIVKVQKSLASSPHDFIEDNVCTQKGFHEVPNIEEVPAPPHPPPSLPPRPLPPPPSAHIQPKNKRVRMPFPPFLYDPDRVRKQSIRFNPPPSPPPPLMNNSIKSRSIRPGSIRPQITTPPMNSVEKMLPTCFYPPPENQLLVPVMSSEGLVYKPYTGTCPPNVGFTPHLYGSTPNGPYYLNAPYGIPPSQREMMASGIPIALSYATDPRGFPSTNSTSHDKVVNEVQGSSERHSVARVAPSSHDTLPLFPMEPTKSRKLELAVPTLENGGGDKETRAIKPMPLDGRHTNESAMRIFRSIQEERRQTNVD